MNYYKYITSPAWRAKKRQFYRSRYYNRECYCCGQPVGVVRLQVHHTTYKHLGAEKVSELRAVCSDCHTAIHCANMPLEKRHKALRRIMRKSPTVYEGLIRWYNTITPAIGKEKIVYDARQGRLPLPKRW